MGLVIYCAGYRRARLQKRKPEFNLFDPQNFLEYCHSLGAGGMQCAVGLLNAEQAARLRDYTAEHQLYIEAIVRLPQDTGDVDRFNADLASAAAAGALAARTTLMSGRRYEEFDSLAAFRAEEAAGKRRLQLAMPSIEKYRVPLAIENHKDQRDADRLALLEQIDSEFVGACVDTGNSFALLQDPIATVEAFAPWAKSVHLKDQALQLTDDGFWLGDISLGQGGLDLKRMVSILRNAHPDLHFTLELITRDPLLVPCLRDDYWATFPDLPARDLAHTLRYVREHSSDELQQISALSEDERLAREDANVRASLDYARDQLGL